MKKSRLIVLIVLSLVGNMQGAEWFDEFKGWFASFVVTETNLFLKIPASAGPLSLSFGSNYLERRVLLNPNDEATLTPDQQAELTDRRHAFTHFTPVTFKNKKKGFKIDNIYYEGDMFNTTNTAYIALNDTPIAVGEDDVEMIMENGEWKKYEKLQPVPKAENDVQYTQSSRENPVTVAQDETPVNTAEDESSEEKGKATTFWHYALIPLCLLAVLWVVKRKRNRNSP